MREPPVKTFFVEFENTSQPPTIVDADGYDIWKNGALWFFVGELLGPTEPVDVVMYAPGSWFSVKPMSAEDAARYRQEQLDRI